MPKLGKGKVCERLRMCSDGLEKSSLGEASSLAICSHELIAMICEINRYKLVREIAMSVLTAFHGGRTHASLPQRSDRADSAGDLLRTCTQNATRSEPPEETLLSRAGTRRMAEWVAWKLRTHQHTVPPRSVLRIGYRAE